MLSSSIPGRARQNILSNELNVLHSLENWGASLFLGGIGLVSKQILDWSNPAVSLLELDCSIFLLPAAIGLVAFIYLRCVNYRIRKVRRRLYALIPDKEVGNWTSLGLVGWSMALMPLVFGYTVSWYLSIDNPEVVEPFRNMGWLGISLFGVALAIFICQGKCCCRGRCCNESSK